LRLILSWWLVLCCISTNPSLAQRYSVRGYSQGLGNLNITCVTQDRTGYLWVGTQNGLYRYDGGQFTRYGTAEGMPDRIIDNLFVGPDGTLWISTTAGVYFQRQDGRFSAVALPVPLNEFTHPTGTTFAANRPDQVVTAASGTAVLLQRLGVDEWVAKPMHLEGGSIWSVLYGPDNSLWYGCGKDLCRFVGSKTTKMRARLGLPEEEWQVMMRSRSGRIWLRGQFHIGELTSDGRRFDLRDFATSQVSEPYPSLAEDAQGRILTTRETSLALWEKDHWRMVTEQNGLSPFELQCVFVDREGSVWMGVVGHGLMRWVGEDRWEAYTAADGLRDNLVWAVLRDHRGRLWIGTESGLNWIPKGGNNPKPWNPPGIDVARAGALELSADGALWVGTMTGTLTRIDPRTLAGSQWTIPDVYHLLSESPHRMWAATKHGLYQFDPTDRNRVPQKVVDPVFPSSTLRFTDVRLDPSGRLFACSDQGLFIHDDRGWHLVDPGQSGAMVDLIAPDWKGNLWVSGPAQDFMRLRIQGYRIVEAEHVGRPPLMSQEIVSVIIDHRGWLWVGQDAGVTVYDGKRWRSFTQDDGLIWNDIDSYAIFEDRDGSMWIGTSGGLSHLIAPQAALAGSPPPPVFTQVTMGSATITDGASVKWSSSPLVISMALLSFKDTQDIGIRYRLIGEQGAGWEDTREMTVRYRHLAPGKYRFEVAAVNAAGNAVSPVASLSFTIVPLWWQNRVAQVCLGLFSLAIVIFAWRRRIGQLMRQKRHLEEAVKARTVDLEREKTELVRTREQMRHFAEHDGLTGLWNHRIIVERLRGEVERSQRDGSPLSVMLVDLDYFKRINDLYGHVAGDLALKETGAIFQRAVRSYDWVGRYGGEEFLLILPGAEFEAAQARAETLRQTLQQAHIGDGERRFTVTASFGVASGFPNDYEALIQAADAALYRAKNNGRNCVVGIEITPQASTMPVAD
jgi:diguanylate cyclase (GGDEF)-like protein